MASPTKKLDLYELLRAAEPSTEAAQELIAVIRRTPGFTVDPLTDGRSRVTNNRTGRYTDIDTALDQTEARKALARLKGVGWTADLGEQKTARGNSSQQEARKLAATVPAQSAPIRRVRPRRELPAISCEVMWVGPEQAAEWLKNVPAYQRKLALWWAKHLAAVMRRPDEWELTNEALAFDENGDLLDGLHRVTGVVLANEDSDEIIEVPFLVTRGWPVEVFRKINRGKKRTTSDALYGAGEANYHLLGSTLRTLIQYEDIPRNEWRSTRITDDQIFEKLEANPSIRASVTFAFRAYGKIKLQIPAGAILHHLATKATGSSDAVEAWLRQLQMGEYIGSKDPVYVLREYLRKANESKERIDTARMTMAQLHLYLVCSAWNATVEGKRYRIEWTDGSTPPLPLAWPADRPIPGAES